MRVTRTLLGLRYWKGRSDGLRNSIVTFRRKAHKFFESPPIATLLEEALNGLKRYTGSIGFGRRKAKYTLTVVRSGETIYHFKQVRDLLVWRGQSILAFLISQESVGTSTTVWKCIASENNDEPNMGDDSGNPEANEFSPMIGSLADVTYEFNPSVKPNANVQTNAELVIEGTVISDGSKTLRKIGVIDTVATPERHIIFEDRTVETDVVSGDEIKIRYTLPL